MASIKLPNKHLQLPILLVDFNLESRGGYMGEGGGTPPLLFFVGGGGGGARTS